MAVGAVAVVVRVVIDVGVLLERIVGVRVGVTVGLLVRVPVDVGVLLG